VWTAIANGSVSQVPFAGAQRGPTPATQGQLFVLVRVLVIDLWDPMASTSTSTAALSTSTKIVALGDEMRMS
jgi:hypothetical protein